MYVSLTYTLNIVQHTLSQIVEHCKLESLTTPDNIVWSTVTSCCANNVCQFDLSLKGRFPLGRILKYHSARKIPPSGKQPLRATFHLTIFMRVQCTTGKIQRNNYHHGNCGPSLMGKTSSVSLIFTHRTHRNVKNRWVKSSLKATFHLTISTRGQRATGKIQRNNYHHGSCGSSLYIYSKKIL